MSQEGSPSPFCPSFCEFVKHQDFCCRQYTECNHLKDRELPPEVVELTICGQTKRVTIVGENDVFKPIYYLKDGGMLPKNYKIFSEVTHTEEIDVRKINYDRMKAEQRKKSTRRR